MMDIKPLLNYSRCAALGLLFVSTLGCTYLTGERGTPPLPPSANWVESFRIGNQLLHVSIYNMELEPKLGVELLAPQSAKVLDETTFTQIILNNEVLEFADSSGVFVEDVETIDSGVLVIFDYFYLRGGSDLIQCSVPVQAGDIGEPSCRVE